MSTPKTPQEIAREVWREGMMRDSSIQDLMIRSIEADRAQWRWESAELQGALDRFTEASTNDEEHEAARELYEIVDALHTHAIDQDLQEQNQ